MGSRKRGCTAEKIPVLPVKFKPFLRNPFSDLVFIFRMANVGNYRKVCDK